MQSVTYFAIPESLHAEALTFERGGVTILASIEKQAGQCPKCGRSSRRVRGHYRRTVADLPWTGVPVRFRVRVRKFQCENPSCRRKIFAEQLQGVARRYARRTNRQREALEEVGFALGGEAGSRLATFLGLPTSPDTIIWHRYLKSLPEREHCKVRVLGIDDWSWRKKVRYGTILVDLERHEVIDLLPDREAESVVAWLEQHPEVEVIARDRHDTYRKAAIRGASQAIQVVDRWHLLKNLVEYLEKFLLHHTRTLKAAAPLLHGMQPVEMPPVLRLRPREDEAQQSSKHRHQDYLDRWKRVHSLHEVGADIADIARTVGLSRTSVYRYLRMRDPPQRHLQKPRTKTIDPYKDYLLRRWKEGCHDRGRLYREIRQMGYQHCESNVFRFFGRLRRMHGQEFERVSGPSCTSVRPPSAIHVATLLVRRPEELEEQQREYLKKLCELSEEIQQAYELTKDFCVMLRNLEGERLDGWMRTVEDSDINDLRRFVLSMQRDYEAVKAGLTLSWSNGQTEGQVNRLKLLKRQSYGRAGFDLLRSRVLKAA